MPKNSRSRSPFTSGDCLFLFEGSSVRILGSDGTEATIPLEDLKALLEHLAESNPPPPSPPESEGE